MCFCPISPRAQRLFQIRTTTKRDVIAHRTSSHNASREITPPKPPTMSLSTKSSRRRTLISSFVFTPEEAKYLKAVLRWNAAPEDTPSQRRPQAPTPSPPQHAPPPPPPPPNNTPQLRLLILGAPSVGKTTLLNRVSPPPLFPHSHQTCQLIVPAPPHPPNQQHNIHPPPHLPPPVPPPPRRPRPGPRRLRRRPPALLGPRRRVPRSPALERAAPRACHEEGVPDDSCRDAGRRRGAGGVGAGSSLGRGRESRRGDGGGGVCRG